MNTEYARRNMITQQFRTNDIVDDDLLTLLQSTPREHFVPTAYEHFAFADMMIPLSQDKSRCMLTPLMEAKILKAVDIQSTDKVLEIGTGSAYLTCLLGKLADSVVSCDIHTEYLETAKHSLSTNGVHHVELVHHDGYEGYSEKGPFDVIIYTGAVPHLPKSLLKQLKPGGRLFAFVGRSPVVKAMLFTKDVDSDTLNKSVLFETDVPALHIAKPVKEFIF